MKEDPQAIYSELVDRLDEYFEDEIISSEEHLLYREFIEIAFNAYINDRLNGLEPEGDTRRE